MSRRILPNLQAPRDLPPSEPAPSGPPKHTYARRGKITIVACVPCRKRKTKCDGKRPSCGQCINREGRCTYDMTDEQRKLTYLREHSDNLQQKQQTIESLLNLLQEGEDDVASSIFHRLRSGEPAMQIAEHFVAGKLLWDVSRQGPSSASSISRTWSDGTTLDRYSSDRSLVNDALTPSPNHARLREFERLIQILQTSDRDTSQDILGRIRQRQDISQILHVVDKGKDRRYSDSMYLERESDNGGPVARLENDWESERLFGLLRDSSATTVNSDIIHAVGKEKDRRYSDSMYLERGSDNGGPVARLENNWESERSFGLLRDPNATIVSSDGFTDYADDEEPRFHAGPWTTVTRDQEVVQHLLRLYFTWQHAFFQNFPEDLFRRDMEAGRTKYCSVSLVNALCAAGCYLSNREHFVENRKESDNMSREFLKEALEHLDRQRKPTIPSIAAMYLISYVEGYRGDSSNQWIFGGRSSLMALDLRLHLDPDDREGALRDPQSEKEAEDEILARSHAFWGCFHVMQLNSFTLGRLPLFSEYAIRIGEPEVDREEDAAIWEAYEMSLPERPGARSTTFRQCASLSKIISSTLYMFYAPTEELSGGRLVEEYNRYRAWYQQLPAMIRETNGAPPHVLCLHLYFHSAVLLLWRPFLKGTVTNSNIIPRDICRQAADAISIIWSHHLDTFGLSGVWQFQVNCLLIASTIHVINMPAPSAIDRFIQACTTFQDLVSWHGWAKASLNTLRSLVDRWEIILPPQCEDVLYRDLSDPAAGDQKMESNDNFASTPDSRHPSHVGPMQRDGPFDPRESPASAYTRSRNPQQAQNRTRPHPHSSLQTQHASRTYHTPPPVWGLIMPTPERVSTSSESTSVPQPTMQALKRQRVVSEVSQVQATAPSFEAADSGGDDSIMKSLPGLDQMHGQAGRRATYSSGQLDSFSQDQRRFGGPPSSTWQQQRSPHLPFQMMTNPVMTPSSYIYQPDPIYQAPMLMPGHLARAERAPNLGPAASNDQQPSALTTATWHPSTVLPGGVQGLTFDEPWRDPYYRGSRQQQQQQHVQASSSQNLGQPSYPHQGSASGQPPRREDERE